MHHREGRRFAGTPAMKTCLWGDRHGRITTARSRFTDNRVVSVMACSQQLRLNYNSGCGFLWPLSGRLCVFITRHAFLVVAVATASVANCVAKEVGSVDLTKVTARTELRRPASSPGTRQHGGILADHLYSDTIKNTGALRTTLVSLDRTQYRVGDEPTFEITVENVGSASLWIPYGFPSPRV